MQTWLTRMSFLDTFEELETPLLAQTARHAHELMQRMLMDVVFDKTIAIPDNHPIIRVWTGHEIALAAYVAGASAELNRRGVACGWHLAAGKMVHEIRLNEDAPFEQPPWLFDTDLLRSHRSNMVRRWPSEYGDKWSGTPELMPYLWPFTDEDGSFGLYLSGHDKELLARGERKLPKSIKNRVENL